MIGKSSMDENEIIYEKVKALYADNAQEAVELFQSTMDADAKVVWAKRLADELNDIHFIFLCGMLSFGTTDWDVGLEYLGKAADMKHPNALYQMGYFYEFGVDSTPCNFEKDIVIKPDFVKALEYYTTPAYNSEKLPEYAHQLAASQYRASILLKNEHKGLVIDELASAEWAYKAAAQGDKEAIFSLGVRQFRDTLNESDPVDVHKLLQAFSMMEFAVDYLPELKETDTFKTLKKAARTCLDSYFRRAPQVKSNFQQASVLILPSGDTGKQVYDMALFIQYQLLAQEKKYAGMYFVASAFDYYQASFEYARILEFSERDWITLDPQMRMQKAVAFYWDSAKHGHILSLLALTENVIQEEQMYRDAIYYLFSRGPDDEKVKELIGNLVAPAIGDVELFLTKEKASSRKIWAIRDPPAVQNREEVLDAGCCVIL
jgi:TPR repeat protein